MDPMLDQVNRGKNRSDMVEVVTVAAGCAAGAVFAWLLVFLVFFAIYGAEVFLTGGANGY